MGEQVTKPATPTQVTEKATTGRITIRGPEDLIKHGSPKPFDFDFKTYDAEEATIPDVVVKRPSMPASALWDATAQKEAATKEAIDDWKANNWVPEAIPEDINAYEQFILDTFVKDPAWVKKRGALEFMPLAARATFLENILERVGFTDFATKLVRDWIGGAAQKASLSQTTSDDAMEDSPPKSEPASTDKTDTSSTDLPNNSNEESEPKESSTTSQSAPG